MRHSLPVLNLPDRIDQIEIRIPCEVSWESMLGDARVRHCSECRQNVYNVASMTRPEALRLLESSGGRVCVRIFRRPDGTVMTADCRERLRQARQRGVLVFLSVLVLVLWAQVSAQIVGLVGLRWLLTGGGTGVRGEVALAGTPVPVPVPNVQPLPIDAPAPTMGEPEMGKPAPPLKPAIRKNRPPKRDLSELVGRLQIR